MGPHIYFCRMGREVQISDDEYGDLGLPTPVRSLKLKPWAVGSVCCVRRVQERGRRIEREGADFGNLIKLWVISAMLSKGF